MVDVGSVEVEVEVPAREPFRGLGGGVRGCLRDLVTVVALATVVESVSGVNAFDVMNAVDVCDAVGVPNLGDMADMRGRRVGGRGAGSRLIEGDAVMTGKEAVCQYGRRRIGAWPRRSRGLR